MMDTHLTILSATLLAINRRQAAARKKTNKGLDATPFTTAVLNREKLDILTYIRDADPQLEANLFWYPPPPQSHPNSQSHSGPSQYSSRSGQSSQHQPSQQQRTDANDAQDTDQLLAPRLPEPRQIQPPTPLRHIQQKARNEFGQESSADVKTLLLAAQRLNDNYRNAPKARKHIKGLLKKHVDLTRTVRSYENVVVQNDARIRSLLSGHPVNDMGKRADLPPITSEDSLEAENLREELEKIRETAQKEELEILALEELINEMDEEARQQQSKQEKRLPSHSPVSSRRHATPVLAPSLDSKVSPQAVRAEPKVVAPVETEESVQDISMVGEDTVVLPEKPAVAAPPVVQQPEPEEEPTVRLQPDESTTSHADDEDVEPETSEELERVTSNVWKLFGDSLRHVAADKDGSDFLETLRLLKFLTAGGNKEAAGDTSLGSAHTFSTQTSQTTDASNAPIAPFSPDVMMTAFVIVKMLVTPAPHRLNIEELKVMGHEWWTREGKPAYLKATRTDAEDDRPRNAEVSDDGQNLARKAVYGMVSKQLFTVRRQRGVGTIEFA